jgi:hypothetical protein
MSTHTSRRYFVTFSAALAASGCVSSRLDLPSDHPANAKAKPASLELASLLATPSAPAGHAHAHTHQAEPAAPTADRYTCPMHPEVVQNAPGKCPICGMNLVKK